MWERGAGVCEVLTRSAVATFLNSNPVCASKRGERERDGDSTRCRVRGHAGILGVAEWWEAILRRFMNLPECQKTVHGAAGPQSNRKWEYV